MENETTDTGGLFEKQQLTEEIAEQEFERMLKAARVKWHLFETKHGKRDVEPDRAVILDALMYGQIELNEDGFPTINTAHESEKLKRIVMRGRGCGADYLVMDRIPEGQEIKKVFSAIGKSFGLTAAEVSALDNADFNVLSAVHTIFLG